MCLCVCVCVCVRTCTCVCPHVCVRFYVHEVYILWFSFKSIQPPEPTTSRCATHVEEVQQSPSTPPYHAATSKAQSWIQRSNHQVKMIQNAHTKNHNSNKNTPPVCARTIHTDRQTERQPTPSCSMYKWWQVTDLRTLSAQHFVVVS